jgi:addiction module RelE/StbE family toxin
MRIRWTNCAAADLESIVNFIRTDNPEAAHGVGRKLYSTAESLSSMPSRGRVGLVEGTRELIVARLPYILVYQVFERDVLIIRVRHAAQEWPPA